MFSLGPVAEKNLPQPSNEYLCPSLPPSSPLGLGRRRGAGPGCGLAALPVQSLLMVSTGRLYSYLHATLV